MTAVLLALTEDSFCGAELSRRTGYAQPSVSCWLRRLGAFGLAEVDFVIQGRAGGRAAEFWALTEAGRELAEALFAESSAVAS